MHPLIKSISQNDNMNPILQSLSVNYNDSCIVDGMFFSLREQVFD